MARPATGGKQRKRVNGTGSVAQLKDGRWVASAIIDGERVYRYRRSRKDADLALAAILNGTEKPTRRSSRNATAPTAPDSDMTLSEWITAWLETCEGRLRPSTCHNYKKALARVIPIAGETRIADLTPASLTATINRVKKRGTRAAQDTYTVLRTCLQAAADLEILPRNPMLKVAKPRHQPKERDYWNVTQTRRFIDCAMESDRKWAPLCAFLVTTGLRISEAFGLTWADIDLANSRIRIRESIAYVGQQRMVSPPKTKASRRWVSLDASAREVIARMTPGQSNEGVFRTKNGKPPTPPNVREALLHVCEEAGVPPLNPHGLRHVAAMLALTATRDIYLVQRRLGHANVNVTLGIYGYSADDEGEVAGALDRLLDPPAMSSGVRFDSNQEELAAD